MRTIKECLQDDDMIDFLFNCKMNFKFFCERVLGLTDYGGIHNYQVGWFEIIESNERIIIQAPRGFSKTTIAGVAYPLWVIFNQRNKKILLISKTIEQSKDALLMQIRTYLEDIELFQSIVPKDKNITWNSKQLKTTNGCSVTNRPYSENVKSYRSDIVILDESDSYEDPEIYFDSIVPTLNPGGKMILISTPKFATSLMNLIFIRDVDKQYKIIKTYAVVDKDGNEQKGPLEEGFSIWPERFPIKWLVSKRKEIGNQLFRRNYMNDIETESEDSIFKFEHIIKGYDDKRDFTNIKEVKDSFIILAADFAISSGPRADFDAYVILEKRDNLYILKHLETWKGIPTPQKITRLEDLIYEYKVDLTIADESNVGHDAINDLLTRGYYVLAQKFSSEERKKLLITLKRIIESGKLIIPRNPNNANTIEITNLLATQLMGFFEKRSEKTNHKLIHSGAAHDDLAISVAMAVSAGTKQIVGNFFDDVENVEPRHLLNPFEPK